MKITCAKRFATWVAATFLLLTAMPARAADEAKPDKEAEALRAKWENLITFYGEEDTGNWSLRILDKVTTERAIVKYIALWKYDIKEKRWLKLDTGTKPVQIVLPSEKGPNDPNDSQVIAELPLKLNAIGLYYATWKVNDQIDGASFCKIGPTLVGQAAKDAKDHPPKAGPKQIVAIVPITLSKAELMVIPDPRYASGQLKDEKPEKGK